MPNVELKEKKAIPELSSQQGFPISLELENAFLEAFHRLKSGESLDTIDIFSSFLGKESLAGATINAISHKKGKTLLDVQVACTQIRAIPVSSPIAGSIRLENSTIPLSASLYQILESAKIQAASDGCIDTGHFLSAEVMRPDSQVTQALVQAGLGSAVNEPALAVVIKEFTNTVRVKRVRSETPGQKLTVTIQSIDEKASDAIGKSEMTNLLSEAKTGTYKDLMVKKEWLQDTLSALQSNSVVALMTDYEEEADILVEKLADQLSRDTKGIFPYTSIIVPDRGALLSDPDRVLSESIRQAQGGILMLRAHGRLLKNELLLTAVGRGDIKLITYADDREWGEIRSDLTNRVRTAELFLDPPTQDELLKMMNSQKKQLEERFSQDNLKLKIKSEALGEAVKLAVRYAGVLDVPPTVGVLKILSDAVGAIKIAHADMPEIQDSKVKKDRNIDSEDIYIAFHSITGIEIKTEGPERYLTMEDMLRKRVIGQEQALDAVSEAIKRAKSGLKDPKRPIGSFLFLGPSGVGKTELSKALAEFMFDRESELTNLNMGEYMEKHAVARMYGAPPGYVGYEEGGQLTEPVRKKPYQVVNFDEIEKAHPDAANVLLSIMEEGTLTDGRGRTADFRNTVITVTGNVGSRWFEKEGDIGRDEVEKNVMEDVKATFRPEFLNRFDAIIIFNSLTPENVRQIVDIQERALNKKLKEQNQPITVVFSPETKDALAKEGYDPKYGVRELKRVIQRRVENILSEKILTEERQGAYTVQVDFKEGAYSLLEV